MIDLDWPKADLHYHFDGALRPQTARELARAAGLDPDAVAARLVAPHDCSSHRDFIAGFHPVADLLQTEEALERVAYETTVDCAADGVDYVEPRWAPLLYTRGGLSTAQVIRAVLRGLRAGPIPAPAIVVAMRHDAPEDNVQLAREAAAFLGEGVVAFDLAGDETGYPTGPQAPAFAVARAAGLGLTCHAGEVGGPQNVEDALRLGVGRIGHGVRGASSPALVERLRREGTVLEVCPTANAMCGTVPSLAEHPLPQLIRSGVRCAIGSDSPTIASTTLSREFERAAATMGLTEAELRACDATARAAAFGAQARTGA